MLCGQCLLAAALLEATPAQKRPSAAVFEDPLAQARREETKRLLRLAGTPLWKEGNPFPYYGARAASQRLVWFVRRHRGKPPHEVISASWTSSLVNKNKSSWTSLDHKPLEERPAQAHQALLLRLLHVLSEHRRWHFFASSLFFEILLVKLLQVVFVAFVS